MSTFGTMQSRIRDELNRGTNYDTAIRHAIADAIDFYKIHRFTWNEKRTTTTTVAGTEYYGFPSDFIEVDMIRVKYTSGDYTDPLMEVTYRWIEEHRHNVNYRSEPEKFAVHAESLRLWPVPDAAYELMMTYLYEDTSVSASASDGATNEWMTDGYELIKSRAKADVLENYVRGQEAALEAQINRNRENQVFKALRKRANRFRSGGRLTPHL